MINTVYKDVAAAQHAIWANWMTYLFQLSSTNEDGSVTIPAEMAARWKRQVVTSFGDLPTPERNSDYDMADLVIKAIGEGRKNGYVLDAVANGIKEKRAIRLMHDEYERAQRLWPAWPTDPFAAFAILVEEVGEIAKALVDEHVHGEGDSGVLKETVQTAAMVLRFLLETPGIMPDPEEAD